MNNSDKKLPGRPRSLQSHQAMLQATLELLGEVGFDAMSIDAIAYRAGVGKTTIYRRYASKEELVVDAIESVREEIVLPDTGNLQEDIEAIVQNAAETTLSPLGRKTVAMLIGSALSNPQFAEIYWTKYLQPRRRSFAIVLERAKARNEIPRDLDSDLVFDMMSGIMLYALVFQPTLELWSTYVRRAISLLIDR
jgi:AcrR family transcriptional regulator